MSRVTQDTRWYCHECSTAFREPIRNGGNDLPLCPNCMSDVVEERELDAPEDDSWFPSDHPVHDDEDQNFLGFFNPPSMVGNRQANVPRQGNNDFHNGHPPDGEHPLAALMQLFGGGPMQGTSDNTHGQTGGPRIRTFTLGNGAGSGFFGGATISVGGVPTLGRDEYGYIRDPWGEDPFGQARGSGRGRERTADQAASDRFGDSPSNGNNPFGGGGGGNGGFGFVDYHPEPGAHVTIEDLLAHFLSGMTGLGVNGGNGPLGDYVLSDEGLDRVLEELMNAAGEHNRPPPASDLVIDGLPRIKLDQATLGMGYRTLRIKIWSASYHFFNCSTDASQYKDCSICLTEFELDQEVIRIPCNLILVTIPYQAYISFGVPGTLVEAERYLSGLVLPESERNRPRTQAQQENAHANSPLPPIPNPLGEHGVGGVINNVFHNISRFFTGGDEQHAGHDENVNSTEQEGRASVSAESAGSATSTSNPPGAFPRPVSPTVDDHPDHPINIRSNGTDNSHDTRTSTTQNATSSDRATLPEHAVPDHEDVRDMARLQPDASADNSAARFISSLFDQRGGSPLSGNGNPRSPGPMGTASYFGRTSSPPHFIRNPSNPPLGSNRDFSGTSVSERPSSVILTEAQGQSRETSSSIPSPSVAEHSGANADTTARTEEPHSTSEQDKDQQHLQVSPMPTYPTVIPAEYRERQARREAMIREQEQHSGKPQDTSTDEHDISA
ncbi:hypothetical protein QFC19_001679 [Naganishia cerealis]|uniref:Uncharacterized protein n=1 Tax=Naganishia cerealis TaxID=610337 RepID=A0ACC2WHH1_9TREE|nr:hypothetical protein QFC19_001679 [Naganishia cerealis]